MLDHTPTREAADIVVAGARAAARHGAGSGVGRRSLRLMMAVSGGRIVEHDLPVSQDLIHHVEVAKVARKQNEAVGRRVHVGHDPPGLRYIRPGSHNAIAGNAISTTSRTMSVS